MIGQADLADWTYDESDELAASLRRHDSVHAVICGADARALSFPPHLRPLVCRFARLETLALDELASLVAALPAT